MNIKNMFSKLKCCRGNEFDIDMNEMNEIISSNSNIILLDVRSPQEYQEGHLNGATNIPLYELEKCCECTLKDKDKIIIVYCQSGIRSKRAINILKKYDFKNIYNLKDGLDGL